MHARHHDGREVRAQQLASMLGDPEPRSEQRLGRGRAQTEQRIGLDDAYLRIEPRLAREDVRQIGLLVDPLLPARRPSEVLHRVGHVDVVAGDVGVVERAVEDPAGRSYERVSLAVLVVAGLLADHHDTRAARALTEDGLGPEFVQFARGAARGRATKGLEARALGHQRGGRLLHHRDLTYPSARRPSIDRRVSASRGAAPPVSLLKYTHVSWTGRPPIRSAHRRSFRLV